MTTAEKKAQRGKDPSAKKLADGSAGECEDEEQMPGYSAKLPLFSVEDGYALNKTVEDTVKQNLKMLMLTTPGERIMLPNFGAGLIKYLFELDNPALYSGIRSTIESQVKLWLPFVEILNVTFDSATVNP